MCDESACGCDIHVAYPRIFDISSATWLTIRPDSPLTRRELGVREGRSCPGWDQSWVRGRLTLAAAVPTAVPSQFPTPIQAILRRNNEEASWASLVAAFARDLPGHRADKAIRYAAINAFTTSGIRRDEPRHPNGGTESACLRLPFRDSGGLRGEARAPFRDDGIFAVYGCLGAGR